MTTVLGAMMLAGALIAWAYRRYAHRPVIVERWLARDLRAGYIRGSYYRRRMEQLAHTPPRMRSGHGGGSL